VNKLFAVRCVIGIEHVGRGAYTACQVVCLSCGPRATVVNYVYRLTMETTQQFRRLGVPLIILPRASREPARNDGFDPVQ
jgi:hypothetical protein